ncbi:MAG: hypothetical protein AAGL34_18945 [Bacteroidota bacterium]
MEEATLELANAERKLKDLPKKVFKEVLILTGVAILFPFLPGKRGREPMIKSWEYDDALIFTSSIFGLTYIIGYFWRKEKLQKRIRELKLKEHILSKAKN